MARRRATTWSCPVGRRARRPPTVGGLHRPRALGLRGHGARAVPAAAALPLLRALPQAGGQAGRPRARAATCAATRSRDEQKARDFDYYEALTVRDSSLSACTQAIIAAEVGHLELAYDYFGGGGAHRPPRPRAATPTTASTSRRSPAPGSRPSPGSAACATTAASSRSRRACPPRLERLAFRLHVPRPPPRVEVTQEAATYPLRRRRAARDRAPRRGPHGLAGAAGHAR